MAGQIAQIARIRRLHIAASPGVLPHTRAGAIGRLMRKAIGQRQITENCRAEFGGIVRRTNLMIKLLYHKSMICQYPAGRKIRKICRGRKGPGGTTEPCAGTKPPSEYNTSYYKVLCVMLFGVPHSKGFAFSWCLPQTGPGPICDLLEPLDLVWRTRSRQDSSVPDGHELAQ